MNLILLFSSILFISEIVPGQDTLSQTNSSQFGFTQSYIMNDNGTFNYVSQCNCTGTTTCGSGSYKNTNQKIVFRFDSKSTTLCNDIVKKEIHKLKKKESQYYRIEYYKMERKNTERQNYKRNKSNYNFILL